LVSADERPARLLGLLVALILLVPLALLVVLALVPADAELVLHGVSALCSAFCTCSGWSFAYCSASSFRLSNSLIAASVRMASGVFSLTVRLLPGPQPGTRLRLTNSK
jgi:hypothetical protein